MRTPSASRAAAAAAILAALTGSAAGHAMQPEPSPAAAAASQPVQPLPPQIVLGQRSALAMSARVPLSTVVIVSNAVSYCRAIAAWSSTAIFPVLVDDGSFEAREDIARFVRGYQPAHVVRWNNPPSTAGAPAADGAGADSFSPVDVNLVTVALGEALLPDRASGVTGEPPSGGTAPTAPVPAAATDLGLVFAGLNDPAWTAGLALAAGRGQSLHLLDVRQQVDGYLSMAEAATVSADVRAAARASGLPFAALGDTLDAVTLCVNAPIKFRPSESAPAMLALTDFVGRTNDGTDENPRWAWCGQVHGTAAQAAYRAMSSLFIQPRTAWLFDGYPNTPGWNEFDATASGDLLKKIGFGVEVLDTPGQSARDWRIRCARPIHAGLIAVTTKGNSDFFDLEPGQCKPDDVPIVTTPFALHFTHSWSIERPTDRGTVGGRWLERGAFMYVGSVHEPFLHAFVPTPTFVGRAASGAPFIASARHELGPVGSKPWKVATLGDPLFSLVNRPKPVDRSLALAGTVAVGDSLREDLTAGNYADAIDTLVLLGRDADAAKLGIKIRDEKPDAFRGGVAARTILPLFRQGQNREVLLAFALADLKDRRNPALRDAASLASFPFRESGAEEAEVRAALDLLNAGSPAP